MGKEVILLLVLFILLIPGFIIKVPTTVSYTHLLGVYGALVFLTFAYFYVNQNSITEGFIEKIPMPFHIPATTRCINKTSIPFTLYQTWSTNSVPPDMYKIIMNNLKTNPCFEYYFYSNKDCYDFIKNNFDKDVLIAFESLIPGAYKADLWRYCIMYKKGGVYLDVRHQIVGNLKLIVEKYKECYVKDVDIDRDIQPSEGKISGGVYQAVLISPPNRPIYKRLIDQIVSNVKNNYYGITTLDPTACRLFYQVIKEFNEEEKIKLKLKNDFNGDLEVSDGPIILFKSYLTYQNERREIHNEEETKHYGELWREGVAGAGLSTANKDAAGNFVRGIYRNNIKLNIEVPRQTSATKQCKNKSEIPLTIYQTWPTRDVPHDMYEVMMENIKKNPCFNYFLYNDEDCSDFIKNNFDDEVLNAYNKFVPGTYKADLWRYCILYAYGGVYLDAKFKIVGDLMDILETYNEFYIQDFHADGVYQGIMCVPPKRPHIKRAIDSIVANVKNNYYGESNLAPTGPNLMKKILKESNLLNLVKLKFTCPDMGDTLENGSAASCRHQLKNEYGRLLFDGYPTYRKEYEVVRKKNKGHYYIEKWDEGKAGEGRSNVNKDRNGKFIKGIYS